MKYAIAFIALFSVIAVAIAADRTESPYGAEVYIVLPRDGATVESPVRVVFGLRGMGVAPAGITQANTGHHHLLIDRNAPPLDKSIPADAQTVHFGGGQTETTVELTPGEHTLQLLLGDALHVPHEPPVISKKITIIVRPPEVSKDADL